MADNARQFRSSRGRRSGPIYRLLIHSVFCLFVAGCAALGEQAQTPSSGMTIGVQTMPITQAIASGVKTNAPSGLYVMSVDARHPAARAGIRKGDVLIACGAKSLDDDRDLRVTLDATEPGSKLMFTVWRDGVQRRLLVTPEVAKPRA